MSWDKQVRMADCALQGLSIDTFIAIVRTRYVFRASYKVSSIYFTFCRGDVPFFSRPSFNRSGHMAGAKEASRYLV